MVSPSVLSPDEQQRQYIQCYNSSSLSSTQGNDVPAEQPARWTDGTTWASNGEASVQPGASQQNFLGPNNLPYAEAPPSLDDQASEASSDTSSFDSASSTGALEVNVLSDRALLPDAANAIGNASSLSSYGKSNRDSNGRRWISRSHG